ncbi:CMRF35-like molecule 1 [Liparis tanakae]|uniref:CMRF35-like molecule 1 n=1 Tax=Liparis tanakae TaxID=230148 RepID=A0A4Z2HE47_9TELE|nr:CMRF35-like molecule 1 [Liparis tanakae]
MRILHVVMFCCFSVLQVSGHVGAEVSIHCSGRWTADNSSERHHDVYFCNGVCAKENILIQTAGEGSEVTRHGRYSMEVNEGHDTFRVTIKSLKRTDAGTYHCSVEGTLRGWHQEVTLIVLDASTVPLGWPPSTTPIQTGAGTLPQASVASITEPSLAAWTRPAAEDKSNQAATPYLKAAGTEAAGVNVEGLEGGEVSFHCSHGYAWSNQKYLCKDPCKASQDVMVTVQNGGGAASGRMEMADLGNGVSFVTFSHLQLSDMGRYWCAVERFGFDTFIEVHVSVQKGNILSNLTASINPNGGENISSRGAALYATVGAVATLAILMLVIIAVKRGVKLKPQPRVCSNGEDLDRADEGDESEYDDIGEVGQAMKKTSEFFSHPHYPKHDVERSAPLHIYEGARGSKGTEHPRRSGLNVQEVRAIGAGIYIKLFPPASERTGRGRVADGNAEGRGLKRITEDEKVALKDAVN